MLKFGSFDTEIEPTLGIGMIINPTEWFQNQEIKLRNMRALDRAVLHGKTECPKIVKVAGLADKNEKSKVGRNHD